jgi:hypothetical protein
LAKLTRNQIVERAIVMLGKCAYTPAGKPANGFTSANADGIFTGETIPTSAGPKLTTDCSAYVAWCWGKSGRTSTADLVAGAYGTPIRKTGSTGIIEKDYPGIQPGDILVRRSGGSGHTAIYIGSNTYAHASTSHWNTSKPFGVGVDTGSDFTYYISYDPSMSFDYDPDTEDPINKVNPPPVIIVPEANPYGYNGDYKYIGTIKAMNRRYIRNYKKCKYMRKGGL